MAAVSLMISLFLTSVVGSVIWLISTEAQAMVYGAAGWNPILIGAVCSAGQNVTYVFLYYGGDRLLHSWPWFARGVQRVYIKWGHKLKRAFIPMSTVGALSGMPPIAAMVALAPSFQIPLRTVLAITLPCRFIRFTLLAWLGEGLIQWWNAL